MMVNIAVIGVVLIHTHQDVSSVHIVGSNRTAGSTIRTACAGTAKIALGMIVGSVTDILISIIKGWD
jgi:hypothetical protein